MSLVLRDDAAGVATLTLNRPEKLNAVHMGVFAELRAHLDAIAADESIGCVILTGAGRAFCAGHDLDAIAAAQGTVIDNPFFPSETVDAIEALPQPTIAKVKGHCLTGGLEMALACDFIIAGESAQFADTHGQWGLSPIWGMSIRLPERIGRARAKEMSYTSRRVNGTEAEAIALANHCYPDDVLDAEVAALAARIVANSASGNRLAKRLFANAASTPRDAALLVERSRVLGVPNDTAERMSKPRK